MPKLEPIVNQEEKELQVPTFTKKEIEEIAFNATVIYIDLGDTANYEKDEAGAYVLPSELVKTIIEKLHKEWNGKKSVRVRFKENSSEIIVQDTSTLFITPNVYEGYEDYKNYTFNVWGCNGYSQVNEGEETINIVFSQYLDTDIGEYTYSGTILHMSV